MVFVMRINLFFLLLLIPVQLSAKEFLNTFLHINFGVMYSLYNSGDIVNYEHDSYSIIEAYGNNVVRPNHYDAGFGITIDISPLKPIVLGSDAHAFKLGIRGCYRFHYFQQKIAVMESEDSEIDYGGNLLTFMSWMVGPVIHYAPSIEASSLDGEYTAGGGFTLYALYGHLVKGELTAYPAQRNYGESVGDYETSVKGYKIDIGIGGEISVCSVNLGLNLYYSMIRIKMADKIYDEVDKNSIINEICVEVYMGIPID